MDPQIRVVLDGDVRTVDEANHEVEARVCAYGVGPDTYNTTWAPGWANESLRAATDGEHTIPMVFGHDEKNISNVVGSVIGNREDAAGMYLRMRFANFDEVPAARTCFSLLRDGHLRGWSFKFRDGKTSPDPEHRGALQFTSAKLVHVSPVVDPSIPGTGTVSVRDADDAGGDGTEDSKSASRILVEVLPDMSGFRAALEQGIREITGQRDLVIRVGADGTVSTDGGDTGSSDTTDDGSGDDADEMNPGVLAQAVDSALDAAQALIDETDTTGLPDPIRQALALVAAAGVAVDELLDALGVTDPDDPDGDEQRAAKAKPYGDVAYADPKNGKYPIDTAEHVKAAWSYINQEKNQAGYDADELAAVKGRIEAAAKKFGIQTQDGGKRDVDDLDVRLALGKLTNRR